MYCNRLHAWRSTHSRLATLLSSLIARRWVGLQTLYPFKNIFDFTTAGDWDCVATVERLPALHYSVDFIFLSFGIMGFIVEL